jgi:hypothetical protein
VEPKAFVCVNHGEGPAIGRPGRRPLVTIEDRRPAEPEDGRPAPEGAADEDLLFPQAYRHSAELRTVREGTARLTDSLGLGMPAARPDQADREGHQRCTTTGWLEFVGWPEKSRGRCHFLLLTPSHYADFAPKEYGKCQHVHFS